MKLHKEKAHVKIHYQVERQFNYDILLFINTSIWGYGCGISFLNFLLILVGSMESVGCTFYAFLPQLVDSFLCLAKKELKEYHYSKSVGAVGLCLGWSQAGSAKFLTCFWVYRQFYLHSLRPALSSVQNWLGLQRNEG